MLRSKVLATTLYACFALTALVAAEVAASPQEVHLQRLTPVLAVDEIEPVVPFWEALGFEATSQNRADGKLIFMAFEKDGYQVHYQTVSRIERDIPGLAEVLSGSTSMLYLAVEDLDAVIEALGDAEVVLPRRQTRWGADEIYVKEPGGHLIGFAEFGRD
jgi:uncharacterized glyoxalase superfamily protein PhnB